MIFTGVGRGVPSSLQRKLALITLCLAASLSLAIEIELPPASDDGGRIRERSVETTSPTVVREGAEAKGWHAWSRRFPGRLLEFVQLRYDCSGWDDGLGKHAGNAVHNFLAELRNMTDRVGCRVAQAGTAKTIVELFHAAKADTSSVPPVLFMTGQGSFALDNGQIQQLRLLLSNGTLLFADAGSGDWDRSFRQLVAALYGANRLKPVPEADAICRAPYFLGQLDPLFAHGGSEVMGYQRQGRWVVLYHPGDLNDLWKDSAQRIKKSIRDHAFQVGVNVFYHALTHHAALSGSKDDE